MEPDGLTRWMSGLDNDETVRRLREAILEQGMIVVAEIDHSAAATAAGLSLPPSRLLVFGAAVAGTPLMQVAPTIGIDLPLKALVWNDGDGTTWFALNDPGWLAARHGARVGTEAVLADMRRTLATVAERATRREAGTA